jgi:DNA-binding transcriptional LysR family regulator
MRNRRPTLVELEALRATIANGTTAGAAQRLGCSQSSVSRALALLEARLGVPLFERAGRLIRPTAEALAINDELDDVFHALDRVASGLAAGPAAGRLTVVAPPAFALALLSRAAARFRAVHPQIVLQVEVVGSDAVVALVAEGRADLGVTDSAPLHSGVRLEPFRLSALACVLPSGHPLAESPVLRPADLADTPAIALTRRHSMRARIDRLFAEAGVERPLAAETSTAISALELVRAGLGVAVMNPFPLADDADPTLRWRPFEPTLEYRSCCVLPAAAPPTPNARRFQKLLNGLPRADRWSRPA